mgnify:CR=1 FL=1
MLQRLWLHITKARAFVNKGKRKREVRKFFPLDNVISLNGCPLQRRRAFLSQRSRNTQPPKAYPTAQMKSHNEFFGWQTERKYSETETISSDDFPSRLLTFTRKLGDNKRKTLILNINLTNGLQFEITPNPATDFILLNISKNIQIQNIYSYNLYGQAVSVEFNESGIADITNLNAGIYFTIISTSNGTQVSKWTKQ